MFFWIEASREIGLGHLMESLALADELAERGQTIRFVVNPSPPAEGILTRRGFAHDLIPFSNALSRICTEPPGSIVVNHRQVDHKTLSQLKKTGWIVAVIDQLGDKLIECDLLVNYSLVTEWLDYQFIGEPPQCCFGAEYALLRPEFETLRNARRTRSNRRPRILVSMGGVDRTGATLRVIEALRNVGIPMDKEVILGGGFRHGDELDALKPSLDDSFSFDQAVDDLGRRMREADLVISAGGNTLYEMACLGTPGLVLWEDPHELKSSSAFESQGTVEVLGNGLAVDLETIGKAVERLATERIGWERMSRNGQALIDGRGRQRIGDAILGLH